jgi:hypothetical protein
MAEKPQNTIMHKNDGIALKDYIDTRFDAVCKEISKAESILNIRLENMNEFRNSLKDQAGTFVTRTELNLQLQSIVKDIREMNDFMSSHRGKASQGQLLFVSVVSIIGVILGLIGLFKVGG